MITALAGMSAAPGLSAGDLPDQQPGCGVYDQASDTWTFCVYDFSGGGTKQVTAEWTAESANAVLFVQLDDQGTPLAVTGGARQYVDGFQAIYDMETAHFGKPTDVDADGHIWILIADLGPDTGGYFDLEYMNGRDLFAANVTMDGPLVAAHELMHVILADYDFNEERWVSEGTGMYGMQAWTKNGPWNNGTHMSSVRAAGTNFTLTWIMTESQIDLVRAEFELAYLFMLYLSDRFGGLDFIGDLMRDGPSFLPADNTPVEGIAGVDAALARAGAGVTFPQVFDDWAVANYLNACAGSTAYCYTSTQEHVDATSSFKDYPAAGGGQIAPWAGQYISFAAPAGTQGSLEVKIACDPTGAFTVRAVTLDAARLKTAEVHEVALDAQNTGTFTYPAFGALFDTVTIVVASHDYIGYLNFSYAATFVPDGADGGADGAIDGGTDAEADAGVDAAIIDDAGVAEDTGVIDDSGVTADAGMPDGAGVQPDAGSDASASTADAGSAGATQGSSGCSCAMVGIGD